MAHQSLQVRQPRPHPHLGAAVGKVERAFAAGRRVGSRAVQRAHRKLRRLENRLRNPGPPLHERGDWYKLGPLEMTPEREAALESLRRAPRDSAV